MTATHIRPGDTGPHRIPSGRGARRRARPNAPRTQPRSRRWIGVGLVAGVAAFIGGFSVGGASDRSQEATAPTASAVPTSVIATTVIPTTATSISTTTTTPLPNDLPDQAPARLVAVTSDGQSLLAIDPRSGESTTLDQVANYTAENITQFGRVSLSPDGSWVFYAALRESSPTGGVGYTLRTSSSGDSEPRLIADGVAPAVSHDGAQLVTVRAPGDALLITDLDATASQTRKPLRWKDGGRIDHPTWAPDDSAIIFEQWQGSQSNLWVFPTGENGPLENDSDRIASGDRSLRRPVWTADNGEDVLLAVERCCLSDQFTGQSRAVSMDPEAVEDTLTEVQNASASELFVDASGAFLLQIDDSGQLRWLTSDGTVGLLVLPDGEDGTALAFENADW